MRVVLDTHILIRVISSPAGPAGALFYRVRAAHLLVFSSETLKEFERVLTYPHIRKLHRYDDESLDRFISILSQASLITTLQSPVPRIVPADPDDDLLVATAIVGQADVLCTRNRHLFHPDVLSYCGKRGIAVMDDLELLKLLRSAEQSAGT
ncbi:MAG: putative toxin-antitoxin system toxin component, PIN family [Pirellulales bacterium]